MSNDVEQFKLKYPTMYTRFLEMNRALAKLMAERKLQHGDSIRATTKDYSNPVSEDFPELPNILEWE